MEEGQCQRTIITPALLRTCICNSLNSFRKPRATRQKLCLHRFRRRKRSYRVSRKVTPPISAASHYCCTPSDRVLLCIRISRSSSLPTHPGQCRRFRRRTTSIAGLGLQISSPGIEPRLAHEVRDIAVHTNLTAAYRLILPACNSGTQRQPDIKRRYIVTRRSISARRVFIAHHDEINPIATEAKSLRDYRWSIRTIHSMTNDTGMPER